MTLVDANVLLDLLTPPNAWSDWSFAALQDAAARGPLLLNDAVYAEISVGFVTLVDLEAALATLEVSLVPMPRAALFRAGKAFRDYRRRGGPRTGVLPDFFIGAHAEVAGLPLLTRDIGRYRSYFPDIALIAP